MCVGGGGGGLEAEVRLAVLYCHFLRVKPKGLDCTCRLAATVQAGIERSQLVPVQ